MSFKNKWFLLSALGVVNMFHQYRRGVSDLLKIQSAVYYLKLLRGARSFYIGFFQGLFCVIFFLMGIFLMHAGIYLGVATGVSRKFWLIFGLGGLETAISLAVLYFLASPGRWVQNLMDLSPVLRKAARRKRKFLSEDDIEI